MNNPMRYIASALESASWPRLLTPQGALLPEIALAGRSNVGKSSFINLLAGQKNLAKISSTPGKTQRLQFFCYEERCILVDLPGYGFAIAPESTRNNWSQAIDQYFTTRKSLRLLLLLLDIRRLPSPDDLSLVRFAKARSIPLLPVLTKIDMLSPAEYEQQRSQILDQISPCLPIDAITTSEPRRRLWATISRYLQ
jgi:GTP-binding protein